MTGKQSSSLHAIKKRKDTTKRRVADMSVFQPYSSGRNKKPTTTLAHAAAASRTSSSKRAQLQGRQVTESTQAPAMAAALEAEIKRDEAVKEKNRASNKR